MAITVHGLVHRDTEVAAASPPAVVPPHSAPAALPSPPDAGMPDAGAAPSAPGPSPSAEPPGGSASAPTPLSSLAAACAATLDPDKIASLRTTLPSLIVECWCRSRDATHAKVAFRQLAGPHDRDTVRRSCKKLRVDL
jgi:hypothetical protein